MGVFRHSAAALAAALGAPVLAAGLAVRPAWRSGWRERLGAGNAVVGGLWLHAASVGEVQAAAPLAEELVARGHALTLSTTSASGRELWSRLQPGRPHRFAPLDHPWCVDAALRSARPRALVLVETELWPVWIAGCQRAGVPIVLVSGRISDRSYPRYLRIARWLRATLERIDAIGARSERDGERFITLGAPPERVSITGDLKLDSPRERAALAPELRRWLGDELLVVGGSTHPGEEGALLDALERWEAAGQRAVLVLAPRYPQRAAEVVEVVRRAGRHARLRSAADDTAPLAAGEVGVLDTLGELAGVFAFACLAFVGGSLVPVGGHNLLEPVLAGVPVFYGPHVESAAESARLLEAAGAGGRVADAGELARALAEGLSDPQAARLRGEAGRAALEAHRGSSRRAADLIESVLARKATVP